MDIQCRCCLSTTATDYIDMFSSMDSSHSFFECFIQSTQLEGTIDDELPKMMCRSCAHDLQVVFDFIQVARQADNVLRNKLVIKSESVNLEHNEQVEEEEDIRQLEVVECYNDDEECILEGILEDDETIDEEPDCETQMELMEFEATEEVLMDDSMAETEYLDDKDKPPKETSDALEYNSEAELDEDYLVEYNEADKESATTNSSDNGTKWKCVECKRVLRGDVSYEGHMNIHRDIRPYKCPQCQYAFRCKYALERHVNQRHKEKVLTKRFHCEQCDKVFRLQTLLDQHHQEEHETLFNCTKCSKEFDSLYMFDKHQYYVHSISASIQCPHCIDVHMTGSKLAEHFRLEHPTEYVKYFPNTVCQYCKKQFETANEFRSHLNTVHSDKSDDALAKKSVAVQCEVCKKQLLRRNIEKHMAIHQKKECQSTTPVPRKYLCAYCPRECKSQKSLHQHEKMHDGESPDVVYMCSDCDRTYSTQHLLMQHRKQAHKERDNKCPICGNAFKLKNQLVNHMKLHLEKNIQCPMCDKKYARQFDLNVHMRSHTGELPFACHLCEKRFAIKVRLTYHLQKHYGIKHRCKVCSAEFNSKQKLKAHSYKHTGMPYRCEMCDDHGFANRDVFKRHLFRVHNTSMTDEALVEMFQRNTGKTTRIRQIDELDTTTWHGEIQESVSPEVQHHKQAHKESDNSDIGMSYRCGMCNDHGFANRDVFKRHLFLVHNTSMSDEALAEMFQRNATKTSLQKSEDHTAEDIVIKAEIIPK